MKKRIILIVVIVAVVGGLAGGIWWYVRRSTGTRLLRRAELALRADQSQQALELAREYARRYPLELHGHYASGRALLRLGRYAEAREPLQRAVDIDPTHVSAWLRLADTWQLPARKELEDRRTRSDPNQSDRLRRTIDDLRQAGQTVLLSPDANKGALDVQEYVGMNHLYTGQAREALAASLKKEARDYDASRRPQEGDQRRREAAAETAAAEEEYVKATAILLEVVRKDVARDTAAEPLVQICTRRGDRAGLEAARAGLEAARAIILAVDEANRPPMAGALLALEDIDAIPAGTASQARKAQMAAAAKTLDGLLAQHPDLVDVLIARAKVAVQAGDPNTAEVFCRRALQAKPNHRGALLLEAQVLYLRGERGEAEAKLSNLAAQFLRWDEPHVLYAVVLDQGGKKDLARQVMILAARNNPKNAQARQYLAEWFLRDSLPKQAAEHARAYYELRPTEPGALRLLIRVAREANDPGLARSSLEEARRTYASRPECLMTVADGYALLGDADQRRRTIEQAAGVTSRTEEGQLARAAALQATGRSAEAWALLETLLARQPKNARVRFVLGQICWQGQQRMEAVEHYRKAAALEPDNVEYRIQLGQALVYVGHADRGFAEANEVLSQDPGNPRALFLASQAKAVLGEEFVGPLSLTQGGSAASTFARAQACLSSGQAEKCIELCEAELAKRPDANDLAGSFEVRGFHELLAQAYARANRKEECLEECKALLAADPERLQIYVWIARLWLSDMPLGELGPALARLPGAKTYMVDLTVAEVLFRAGDFEASAKAAHRAATGDPNQPATREEVPDDVRGQARRLAAVALVEANRPEQALAELDALGGVKGWRLTAALDKVALLHAFRRGDEAKAVLDGARKDVEASGDVLLLAPVAQAYARIGFLAESNDVCEALLRALPDDARPCLFRAGILARAGQQAEAQKSYREAIQRSPENLSAYAALARSLENDGNVPGALDVLKAAASAGPAGQTTSLTLQHDLYIRQGLYEPAVRCLEALAGLGFAEDPRVQLALGQAFARLGRREQAADILQKVPRYSNQYVAARQLLAELAPTDEARLDILRRLYQEKPDLAAVLVRQMAILLRSGHPTEAADLFAKSASSRPAGQPLAPETAQLGIQAMLEANRRSQAGDLVARIAGDTRLPQWGRAAGLLLADQDPSRARAMLGDPNAATPLDGVLGALLWREDASAAGAWLARAEPNADPRWPAGASPLYRAVALVAVGQPGLAEAVLAQVPPQAVAPPSRQAVAQLVALAQADPNVPALAAGLLRAILAAEVGLPHAARTWALEALQARPDCQLAVVIALGAQPNEADLQAILDRIPPGGPLSLEVRAILLLEQKKYAEAADVCAELLRARPEDLALAMRRATALELAGRTEEALAAYLEVAKAKANPAAANNAAYLISQLHPKDAQRLQEAMRMAEQAVAALPNVPSFRDTKGWIAYLLGQDELARRELRFAIVGLASSAEAHCHLGLAEARGGSAEMARLHLESAVALSVGLSPDRAAALTPAQRRAGELAREALKALPATRPASTPASAP